MTPFLIRRFSQPASATAPSGHVNALTQYRLPPDGIGEGGGARVRARGADARRQAGAHHAAGGLDGRRGLGRRCRPGRPADLYVTDSKEGSRNRLFRNRGNGTFEDVAGRLGVADLNRAEDGVSMGAVWGDYDNDGFDDLFLYRWGVPELFHNDRGQALHACDRHGGLAGLGQRQHGRVARLRSRRPPGSLRRRVLPRIREPLEARRHAHDAGELRVRQQRRSQVPVPESRWRKIRGSERARSGSRRAAGRWRRSRPISEAPAIPTSSSRTTTACRSCSPTIAGGFERSDATRVSATRPRAG